MRRLLSRRERGQIIMITAALLPVLMGMAAVAVDVGSYATDRRNSQNEADAIALAAARDLPDSVAAQTTANTYAINNGVDPADMTVTVGGGTITPQVSVTITKSHNFAFMKALGVGAKNVGATAVAKKVSLGGSNGVVPWAVTQNTVDVSPDGGVVVLKYDATGGNLGNFDAIRIDGSGASTYQNDARYGSNAYVCAEGTSNCTQGACPGSYPNVCAENSPTCDGPVCNPETGNMTGPTQAAVDFRMNNTSAACDTFDEAFGPPDAQGKYHLNTACNPWLPGQTCPQSATPCSRRVIIIPVVDSFGNGQTPVMFTRFAIVFLEGYQGTCTGNSCDILARFVTTDVTTNGLAGTYDPGAKVHFIKLVQ